MTMTEPPFAPTVLIVDDEIDMRLLVRVVLTSARNGIEVIAEAVDGDDAVAVFDDLERPAVPDVVILDNRMPGRTGVEVARAMRETTPDQHIILFSAFLTPELVAEAEALGIDACVSKSDLDTLPDLVVELARGRSS